MLIQTKILVIQSVNKRVMKRYYKDIESLIDLDNGINQFLKIGIF